MLYEGTEGVTNTSLRRFSMMLKRSTDCVGGWLYDICRKSKNRRRRRRAIVLGAWCVCLSIYLIEEC